jgi:hypothetical protein
VNVFCRRVLLLFCLELLKVSVVRSGRVSSQDDETFVGTCFSQILSECLNDFKWCISLSSFSRAMKSHVFVHAGGGFSRLRRAFSSQRFHNLLLH